ncbi:MULTISPECIES: hypothetical protein [Pseudomonas]|uniref:Uncharacterized protein n=2 Tax=Gammaproteobacteria TaxID=1236 RepID=A0A1A9KFK6_9PSED|nr:MULTISPECIES: hypothetical protein [Pseudomonas]ANI16304.1 hypothetical protein A9C11_21045 [Pseudomonas citronellolis]EJU9614654.1 hypothetical protein [Pseudomonas aeruginosa]EKU2928211.1 hypothetical protein [Pseudomonas aeruginosa]ELM0223524.1 hypothetical protein [Pseudomonas aeruginosa]KSE83493.1 hypothetical protein AO924_12880 [Pseudomonas aeruginosa]
MASNNDQVFQLSLTEIALTLIFMLMLLLGFMVFQKTQENQKLQEQLKAIGGIDVKLAQLDAAKTQLISEIGAHSSRDPEAVISQLVDASQAKQDVARLKQLLEDQEQQITALSELQKMVEAASGEGGELVKKQVEDALALAMSLKEAVQKSLKAPQDVASSNDVKSLKEQVVASLEKLNALEQVLSETPAVANLEGKSSLEKLQKLAQEYQYFTAMQADTSNPIAVKKENADLKGQLLYLKHRLEANGGMDFPPCWADEKTGKVQMLFTLELRENDLSLEPAWPESRQADAKVLPNIDRVMSRPVSSYEEFLRAVKPIADLSRAQNCRHYVRLKNSISDAIISDRRRLSIEDYFYKIEVRR